MQNTVTDIVCGLLNGFSNFWIHSISNIDNSGCLLKHTKGLDKRWRKALSWPANIKILQRSICVQYMWLQHLTKRTFVSEHPNIYLQEHEAPQMYLSQSGNSATTGELE